MSPLVELRDVVVDHGDVRALDGVDLAVDPGERVALLGPSGAGKTTLLRAVAGAVAPTAGVVRTLGREVHRLTGRRGRAVRARIGTVHQDLALVGVRPVRAEVEAGNLGRWSTATALRALVAPVDRERVAAALAAVDLAGLEEARVDELSGGQRQRVAVARLLVQDPDVVLADEPAANLDPALARLAVALLVDHVATRGTAGPERALVLALHDPDLAVATCDRVVGLRRGRVAFDRPAGDVTAADLDALYAR